MSRRVLCAWDGHHRAVSSPLELSSPSSPIPIWPAVSASSHSNFMPLGDSTAISPRLNKTARLRQFCHLHSPQRVPASLPDELPLKPPQSRPRFSLQHITFMGVGVLLGLSSPRLGGFSLSHTLCSTAPVPAQSNITAPVRPNVSLTASILGPVGVANAETPNLTSKPQTQPLQFIRPVEEFSITSGFGNRIHPISGELRFHHGIDFATPNGTPVKSSYPGIVAFAGWHGGYGKTVIIQHQDDYETLYAHLDKILVRTGDRVTQGKVLGLSGSTGYSTGPHLHFEIRIQQVAHNPMDYLPAFELVDALGKKLPVRVISRR